MATLKHLLQIICVVALIIASAEGNALNISSITLDSSNDSLDYSPLRLTSDRRLALPVGTLLVLTPTVSLPMAGFPYGYGSSTTISIPFKVLFDELGMTSEENTWGHFIKKRDAEDNTAAPSIGDFAGGDREVMYKVLENHLSAVGIDGHACLLRTICEMLHEPLLHHGFLGEIIEIFLSPSRKHSKDGRLVEYKQAEEFGKQKKGCKKYHAACPYSFFTSMDSSN